MRTVLFVLLLIHCARLLAGKEFDLLDEAYRTPAGRNLIDLIIIKTHSGVEGHMHVETLAGIVKNLTWELLVMKEKLMQEKKICEDNFKNVTYVLTTAKANRDKDNDNDHNDDNVGHLRNLMVEYKYLLEERRKTIHSMSYILTVTEEKKYLSYIKIILSDLYERVILFTASSNVETLKIKINDLRMNLEFNSSGYNDTKKNDFFNLFINNIFLLLETNKSCDRLDGTKAIIKNMKTSVKKRIRKLESLENDLISKNDQEKLRLEIDDTSKKIENLEDKMKLIEESRNETLTRISFFDNEIKKSEEILNLISTRCKEEIERLERALEIKKRETSVSKVIKEFTRKDISRILKYDDDDN